MNTKRFASPSPFPLFHPAVSPIDVSIVTPKLGEFCHDEADKLLASELATTVHRAISDFDLEPIAEDKLVQTLCHMNRDSKPLWAFANMLHEASAINSRLRRLVHESDDLFGYLEARYMLLKKSILAAGFGAAAIQEAGRNLALVENSERSS